MKKHLQIGSMIETWLWWDLICVPQHNLENQKMAISSLCYYATLCSRFIPLVRDGMAWAALHSGDSTLPAGSIETCKAPESHPATRPTPAPD